MLRDVKNFLVQVICKELHDQQISVWVEHLHFGAVPVF